MVLISNLYIIYKLANKVPVGVICKRRKQISLCCYGKNDLLYIKIPINNNLLLNI